MILKEKKLHIRCRFKKLEFIVCDSNGNFYQLEHMSKRLKPFRKLNLIKVGGSYGYRINRKFYSCSKLRIMAIPVNEYVKLRRNDYDLPF